MQEWESLAKVWIPRVPRNDPQYIDLMKAFHAGAAGLLRLLLKPESDVEMEKVILSVKDELQEFNQRVKRKEL